MTKETIEFERLEEAIKALNDSGLVEKIEYSLEEGLDLQELLDQFMKATESIPFEKEREAPDIVVNLYNEVADRVKEAAAEDPCEMYGTGWDPKLGECKQCRKDYPDEYEKCKELTEAAQSASVAEEKYNNQQMKEGKKMGKKKKKDPEGKVNPVEKEGQPEKVKEDRIETEKGIEEGKGKGKALVTPQKDFELPLLETLIELGGSAACKQVYGHVQNKVKLLPGDQETRSDGKTIVWQNNVAWVRNALVNKGEIDGSERGVWKITQKGRDRCEKE